MRCPRKEQNQGEAGSSRKCEGSQGDEARGEQRTWGAEARGGPSRTRVLDTDMPIGGRLQ